INLDQSWNDHKVGSFEVPTNDQARLELLRETVSSCGRELENRYQFVVSPKDSFLRIEIKDSSGIAFQRLMQGFCDQSAKGSSLAKRITELEATANGNTPIAVRSTDFPANPKTQIAKQLGDFIRRGGRRVVIQDSEWRTMAAMALFTKEREHDPLFSQWLKQSRPITQLAAIRQILDIDSLRVEANADPKLIPRATPVDTSQAVATAVAQRSAQKGYPPSADVRIGTTIGYHHEPYSIQASTLVRHAAFLGGSGSGKTTLALAMIEQLLMRGVPVVLVDRKGDLCSYAQDSAWTCPFGDARRADERKRLRESIDVAVYTPGSLPGKGRPLTISIAPPGLGHLPSAERTQLANYCAFALGGLMKYKPADQTRIAILGIAIAVLSELNPDRPVNLRHLIDFIAEEDSALVNAIGKLDPKHFSKLVQDLETLYLLKGNLFRADGEALSADSLFGASQQGKTHRSRLSIISTSSLGDQENVTFWVAQLLLEISRYATKRPSAELQAVVMFDEADLYLPAQSKPPTKEPMENLLKRARSAGIGLMLATQSPGDLDYKSRDQISTWFIGRIKESTALQKLKPMMSEVKMDPSSKLAGQQTGEFFAITAGHVAQLKAEMSLVQAQQVSVEEILGLANEQ
ncbi:MAG: ATP-binding protein, partial [Blastocatellia bacterium]